MTRTFDESVAVNLCKYR